MMFVINLFALGNFAALLMMRCLDPALPQIAEEFSVDIHKVASLTTAFALPYALIQPTLGAAGDLFGKARIIIGCLVILVLSCIAGALATSFELLFAARIAMGATAGGVFPLTLAMIGDLVPIEDRQAAVGRLLSASMTGTLMGSAISGVIADFMGWRAALFVFAALIAIATGIMIVVLRKVPVGTGGATNLKGLLSGYRAIFANVHSWIVYPAVFLEGLCVLGLFSFVAIILAQTGESRASIAGLIIAAFSLGGFIYSISVRAILSRIRVNSLMLWGGLIAAGALAIAALGVAWPWMAVLFLIMGAGYYALHGSLQIFGSELAPEARGSAIAFFATCLFLGQAISPPLFSAGFSSLGITMTLIVTALVFALVGVIASRTLWHKPSQNGVSPTEPQSPG